MTTPPPPGMPKMPEDPNGPNSDDKTMAMIAHFGILLGCAAFLPALIIYLIKADRPWVKGEAAKAFNFSIGIWVALIGIWLANFLLSAFDSTGIVSLAFSCVTCLIPLALVATLWVFGIMNGVRTSNGEPTSYPFEIPILK